MRMKESLAGENSAHKRTRIPRYGRQLLALVLQLVFCFSSIGSVEAQPSPHSGKVYDLDYIKNSGGVQVLIRDDFVGFTDNALILLGAETGMQCNQDVWVMADHSSPRNILRLRIVQQHPIPTPPSGLHFVSRIEVDASNGRADTELVDSSGTAVSGHAVDAQMTSLLFAAFRERWFLGYVSIDPASGEIIRAKINREDQR